MSATATVAAAASASIAFSLKYGDQVTIRSTTEVDDGRRLTARYADISGEQYPLPRYVVFDNLPSRERTWRFLPTQAGVNLGDSVKFGDVVALGVVASATPGNYSALGLKTIYLSARGGSTPRQVGFEYGVQAWEQWTIVDPNNPSSTNTISLGDAFALKTSFGDYLSWPQDSTDDPVLQTAASIGAQQSWQTASDPRQTNPAPDGYMNYGDQLAIVATTDLCDRHRVAAKQVDISGDPLPRYAVFDALANESNWRILDSQGRATEGDSPSPIQFGATVTLGMVAWVGGQAQTIYLSCRNGSTPRNIGLNSLAGNSEQWTIVDPEAPNSTDYVTLGSAFALKSTFGDYLSQTTSSVGVLQTASAAGTTITWNAPAPTGIWIAATPVIWDSQQLWHEDWITVLRPASGENTPPLLLSATANAQYFSPVGVTAGPGFIVSAVSFQTGAVSDLNRWIVERTDGQAAGINFGDQVYLSIKTYDDPAQPAVLYLKYFQGVQVGVAPQSGNAAIWKIVNPDVPTSVASVRYGDKVALQELSGGGQYLSASGTSPTLDQSAVATIGDAVTASGSQMPNLPALPSDTDNSGEVLDLGTNFAKTITVGALGLIPEVGGALAGLVGFLWPSGSAPDIWALIEARVNALIDEKLQTQEQTDFGNTISGLQKSWQTYLNDNDPTVLAGMLSTLNTGQTTALGLDVNSAQQTLPHLVAFATIHLAVLHELFIRSLDVKNADGTYQTSENLADSIQNNRQALKQAITDYSNKFDAMRNAALQWRKNLISASAQLDASEINNMGTECGHRAYMQDPFLQSNAMMLVSGTQCPVQYLGNYDYQWYVATDDIAHVMLYQERMAEAFASQLDALTLPSLLWRYLDPDCDDVPARKTATLVTGPFGKLGGAEDSSNTLFTGARFWNLPSVTNMSSPYLDVGFAATDQTDQPVPITGLAAAAGDVITSMQINPPGNAKGPPGFAAIIMAEGERFVAANGCEGWWCNAAKFTTSKGNTMAVGTFNSTTWSASLPADTHPFLTGISQMSSDDGIDQLYLHWQYERWE